MRVEARRGNAVPSAAACTKTAGDQLWRAQRVGKQHSPPDSTKLRRAVEDGPHWPLSRRDAPCHLEGRSVAEEARSALTRVAARRLPRSHLDRTPSSERWMGLGPQFGHDVRYADIGLHIST
jgi:hypothetical protein